MIPPKTTPFPAAAPSTASDTAKQLASLATRTSRCNTSLKSLSSGWPLIQVELEFLTKPVNGDTTPGIPTPTEPVWPVAVSASATKPTIAANVAG